MTWTDSATQFFGWMSVINIGLLLISSIGVIAARDAISSIHGRMFGLESADLSRAYFQYLAQYKIAIIIFSITPYFALKLMS